MNTSRLILSLALVLTTCLSLPARADHDLAIGGNGNVAEFMSFGKEIVNVLESPRGSIYLSAVNASAFARIVNKTQVVQKEAVFLNGQPRDAVNYPARLLITISRSRWAGLSETAKRLLAFHEYLCLMGLEKDDHYPISSTLAQIEEKPLWVCNLYCVRLAREHESVPEGFGKFTYTDPNKFWFNYYSKDLPLYGRSVAEIFSENNLAPEKMAYPGPGIYRYNRVNACETTWNDLFSKEAMVVSHMMSASESEYGRMPGFKLLSQDQLIADGICKQL